MQGTDTVTGDTAIREVAVSVKSYNDSVQGITEASEANRGEAHGSGELARNQEPAPQPSLP